jgi:hypothetical protein
VWVARLEVEHNNLRAVLGWAREKGAIELVAQLGSALIRFWWDCGFLTEGRSWLAVALARRSELPDEVRAMLLWAVGELAEQHPGLQTLFEESLRLYRALGNKAEIADVVSELGFLACMQGDYTQARSYYAEKLAIWTDACRLL